MNTSGNLFRCLRNGLQTGVIFGIIVIFLVLIGFDETAALLIGKFLGNQGEITSSAMILNLVILLGLLGFWAGTSAAKPVGKDTWAGVLIAGSSAGLVCGLMVAILAFILGTLNAAQVGLREYLSELSPDAIRLFIFGLSPLMGALTHIVLFLVVAVLGSICVRGIGRSTWRKTIGKKWAQVTQPIVNSSIVQKLRIHPWVRYGIYGLILLILIGMPQILGQYWNYTVGTVGIYVLLGLGLNIVVGMAGLLDLGYVAFFAIGAYAMALLTSPEPLNIGWGFWVALPIGVLLAALSGILLGIPVLRLRGDYLAIVTLGFGEIIRILSKSDLLTPLTAGPRGVRNVAGPTLFGHPFNNDVAFVYLIIMAILLVIFVTIRLENSRAGRAWIAMREDETVAQAQGINTLRAKLLAFAIGAAFAVDRKSVV
jgi:ribose/xylose/arabinose/galactoside ABC-type transport system permease subunit